MSPLDWTPEAFPGTSLRESDITERRRLSERWDPVARYAWRPLRDRREVQPIKLSGV